MPDADLSSARSWRRDGSADAELISRSGLVIDIFRLAAPSSAKAAAGSRILFFSDLHVRSAATFSWAPFRGGLLSWSGLEWISAALQEAISLAKPTHLVFGGDLVVHSCWLERASSMLASLAPGIPKFAVLGNWDKRRRRWLPHRAFEEAFARAGFRLLMNGSAIAGPIRFYGLDDFKMGLPLYRRPSQDEDGLLNCVVSHNPDGIVRALGEEDLAGVDLLFSGHTHGGQFRLPLLGALATSSMHWKCLEMGLYKCIGSKAKLLVSAGIGATAVNIRFNCPPQAVLVELL